MLDLGLKLQYTSGYESHLQGTYCPAEAYSRSFGHLPDLSWNSNNPTGCWTALLAKNETVK